MPRISSKNQITLPVDVLRETGLKAGDEVAIDVRLPDRIVIRKHRVLDFEDAIGFFDGLYPPGYLKKLRARERY
jgi:bifunctional DNA-binding transcriptional regulator/antitoxin component of YhaV-PrlF toxin-antitoxin module